MSKPFSFSLGSNPASSPTRKDAPRKDAPRKDASSSKNKRRIAALSADDEDEDEDPESHHRGKVQLVSGFDHSKGGALDTSGKEKKKAAPLVIPALSNRDWRRESELRRGAKKPIYIPEEAKRRGELKAEDVIEVENTGAGEQYGLVTVAKKQAKDGVDEEDGSAAPEKIMTEDERAIAALMGSEKKGGDLIIAHTSGDGDWRTSRGDNEDDSYRKDVDSRPDVPTFDDYAAVPVEEFGAAMLRGMGWKGGEQLGGRSKKPGDRSGALRLVEKRPAFLGLGAKPMAEIPELGAWGKADPKKGRRPDTTYIPVVKIDKK